MNFKSIDDILNYAIEKEIEAAEFYMELSEIESSPSSKDSKNALIEFAEQERKHEKMLINLKTSTEKVEDYHFKKVTDLKRSDYMVDIEYEKGMPFNDILRIAMKREEKAYKLYNELTVKVDDDEFKKVFQILANEESKHKNILEVMYDDYMAVQGD